MTGGVVTVSRSLLVGNSGIAGGGGIASQNATVELVHTTVSGNDSDPGHDEPSRGGGILGSPGNEITLMRATVTGNVGATMTRHVRAGGSVFALRDETTCGDVISLGHNVAENRTCGLDQPTDQQMLPVLLGPLADNGGASRSHLPAANSPLVDHLPVGTPGLCDGTHPTDQRGVSQPDGPGCRQGHHQGTGPSIHPLALAVDTDGDALDADPGDGECKTAGGSCSLRAAVQETNRWPAADTIHIAPGTDPGLWRDAGCDTCHPDGGALDVTDHLTVVGNGQQVRVGEPPWAVNDIFRPENVRFEVQSLVVVGYWNSDWRWGSAISAREASRHHVRLDGHRTSKRWDQGAQGHRRRGLLTQTRAHGRQGQRGRHHGLR
ncbi:MAG: choice-of-anchor Q domain-containing protein [Acidimicrobiia bacterium]|nr:choice-of-anchor Q domain-containing protein [Acidimicrobiia bacterium]